MRARHIGLKTYLGGLCCAALAGFLTSLFDGTRVEPVMPLLFLAIIFAVAIKFGSSAGMLGTVLAGLVFTLFLFEPKFSFSIDDPVSKRHLLWMLVAGIILSDLFGAYSLSQFGKHGRG